MVNADMSRSSEGRLTIQEVEITCLPLDRISAYGSGRPAFIYRIQGVRVGSRARVEGLAVDGVFPDAVKAGATSFTTLKAPVNRLSTHK